MIKSNAIVSNFFMVLVAAMSLNSHSHAAPPCPSGHCGIMYHDINERCIREGQAGKPYPVNLPDGTKCECHCSCVAFFNSNRSH